SSEGLGDKFKISSKLHNAAACVQRVTDDNVAKQLKINNEFLKSVLNSEFDNAAALSNESPDLLFQDYDGFSILDIIGEANNPQAALEFLFEQCNRHKQYARDKSVGDFIAQNTGLLEGINLSCLGDVNDLEVDQLSSAITNSLRNNNYQLMTQYLAQHDNFTDTLSNVLQEEKGKELLRQTDQLMVNFVASKTPSITKVLALGSRDIYTTPALPPLSKPDKSTNNNTEIQKKSTVDITAEDRKNLSLDGTLRFYKMGHTTEPTVVMKMFSWIFGSNGKRGIDFESEDTKTLKTSKSSDKLTLANAWSNECDPFTAFALFFNGSDDHIERLKDVEKLMSKYLNFLPDEDRVFANYSRGEVGTPLHVALMTCNTSLALMLLTNSSNKTNIGKIKGGDWEQNAFHAIAKYSHQQLGMADQSKSDEDQLLMIDALLNRAGSPSEVIKLLQQKNGDGDTPLESAIKHGNSLFVKRVVTYLVDGVEEGKDKEQLSYILDAQEDQPSLFDLSSMYGLGGEITASLLELLGVTEKHCVDFNIKSSRKHLTADSANRLLQYYEDTHTDRISRSDDDHIKSAIDNYGQLIERSAELGIPFSRLKPLLHIVIVNGVVTHDVEQEKDFSYESGDEEVPVELQQLNSPVAVKGNKNSDHILNIAKSVFQYGSPRDIHGFLDFLSENRGEIGISETEILQHLSLANGNLQEFLQYYLDKRDDTEIPGNYLGILFNFV
ncbi:MAG: hypothetical protein OEY79_05050, partial [Anaplasmataceae bacterium]|nr:hypothetical protein [Anaplasmataceae bacterium]